MLRLLFFDIYLLNVFAANANYAPAAEVVLLEVEQSIRHAFSCRYLNCIVKATPLYAQVKLSMAADMPLVCEYNMGNDGHIKYYLAYKIDDELDD